MIKLSEKVSMSEIEKMIGTSVKKAIGELKSQESEANEKKQLLDKITDLESKTGMSHEDLKNLGMRYCPDGNCKKELFSEEEYENLEECENCDHKIPNREKIKNCPNCGSSTTKKD